MDILSGLSQSQQFSLQMTPQIQLALKFLQLGSVELNDLINKEILENPALERDSEDEAPLPSSKALTTSEQGSSTDSASTPQTLYGQESERFITDEKQEGREQSVPQGTTLSEFILSQVRFLNLTGEQQSLVYFIVGNLDANGYLDVSNEYIQHVMDVSREAVEDALGIVQSLEPSGIGARTIAESLLIQLDRLGRADQLEGRIMKYHADLLKNAQLKEIAKRESVSVQAVKEAISFMSKLEPYPGRSYTHEIAPYIVPDIYVTHLDGEYIVTLNEKYIPRLRMSAGYQDLLNNKTMLDRKSKRYVIERARSASWIMRCLYQRNATLLKVVKAITRYQRELLEHGVEKLRPLVLREIAQEVGIHESTVSRAIANKYIETPRGVFDLKSFFTHRVKESLGEVSSVAIKELIKKIISAENPEEPLSDKKIAQSLSQKSVAIARRTVAKYREALGVPSYKERRVQ